MPFDEKERTLYFSSHKCTVRNFKSQYTLECGSITRLLLDWTSVNMKSIRARSKFKSYASLSAEKQRQYTLYPFTLHPYSKLRFWAEVLVCVCVVMIGMLMPVWVARGIFNSSDIIDTILLLVKLTYLFINIPINMFTGYVGGKNKQYIVLDNWLILKHYFFTWMIVDLLVLTSVSFDYVFGLDYKGLYMLLNSVGVLQFLVLLTYKQNICIDSRIGVLTKTIVELLFILTNYLSWNIVFQFTVEYIMEGSYRPKHPSNCSWITIGNLWDKSWELRLMYSLTRAVEMMRKNANINLLQEDGCFVVFFIIAWLIAQCVIVHCSFKYMLVLLGSHSAKTSYYIMSQQIQSYMSNMRFPPRIKKKILKFYSIRFQSHFFVESTMMDYVSGQLREDIIMHSGRQLVTVSGISFLKQLPRSALIQISLRFQFVIYIAGDIIFKVNTYGDRMYFIHKGTVATYTESGCEVHHVEDGDYFGEINLVTDYKIRLVTAVAVTNCELFALARENFEMLECYPTAYDEIKKGAIRKMQIIQIAEEQYKAQLRD